MANQESKKSWRYILKLVAAGVVVGLVVVAAVALFLEYQAHERKKCDGRAAMDVGGLSAAFERLQNELEDLKCGSKWEFEEKQIAFMVGPYYGWPGTNKKCQVKVRMVGNEVRGCAVKGTHYGNAGKDRFIYRCPLPICRDLPTQVGPCYGNSYGFGGDGMCFTESILNTDCSPRYRMKGGVTPEEEATCETISQNYDKVGDSLSALAKTSINPFGIALYHISSKGSDNFFFGPLTAYAQFFTTVEITKEETQQEILKALRLKEVTPDLRPRLESLIKAIRCSAIIGGGQYSITDEFMTSEGTIGLAEDFFRPLDTALTSGKERNGERDLQHSGPPKGTKTKSRKKPDSAAGPVLDLGWKNVTYFLGKWGDGLKFDQSSTKEMLFFLLDGKQVTVPMMYNLGDKYFYMENKELQALQIPYGGDGLGMLFLLPKDKKGFPLLEKSLTAKKLHDWTGSLYAPHQGVKVWIPRFGVSAQINWTNVLDTIPVRRIFSKRECQFDREKISLFIKNPALREYPAYMACMAQQAWIEVNEKGTEAYVAGINCANVESSMGGPEPPPPPPIEFRADHPFLFIVRHIPSGTIVFMGRYAVP